MSPSGRTQEHDSQDNWETLMNLSNYILPGAKQVRAYAERLTKGIPANLAATKPVVEGKVIELNHPAFVFGHLSLYPVQIAKMLALPFEMEIPETYPALFKIGTPCLDDREGKIYPAFDELCTHFFRATDQLLNVFSQVDPINLDKELEDPGRRERFGTVGAFAAYILQAHPQVHLGQVSSWRRCVGLGSV
jgi:hypothetical protein